MSRKPIFMAKYGSPKHVDDILNGKDAPWDTVNKTVRHNQFLTMDHVKKVVKDFGGAEHTDLARNQNLPHGAIDHLLDHVNDGYVDVALAANQKHLTPEHIHKLLDRRDQIVDIELAKHKNLQPDHVDKLFDKSHEGSKHDMAKIELAKNHKMPQESIHRVIDKGSDDHHNLIAQHPTLSHETASKLLSLKNDDVDLRLAKRHDLSDEHLNQLAKHHDSYIAGVANRTIRHKQELYNTLKRL